MQTLPTQRKISRFTFKLTEDGMYEARGAMYYDEEHDQVPEPELQLAASVLHAELKSLGHDFEIVHGEKGWIELHPKED